MEGGAARVYKASDTADDPRLVAVKVFTESHDTRLAAEFFARECRALQEPHHPAVIELLDWGTHEETGERFLVLDWMTRLIDKREHGTSQRSIAERPLPGRFCQRVASQAPDQARTRGKRE